MKKNIKPFFLSLKFKSFFSLFGNVFKFVKNVLMIVKIKHQLGTINVEIPLNVNSSFDVWIKLNTWNKRKLKIHEIKIKHNPPDNVDFVLCFERGWDRIFKKLCERLGKESDVEMLIFFTKFFPDKIKYHSKLPNNPFRENSILDIIDNLFIEIRHAMQYCFSKCERELKEEMKKRKYVLSEISVIDLEPCVVKCLEFHKYLI